MAPVLFEDLASRRQFLVGAGSFLAAPAVVRAANLMTVRTPIIVPRRYECGLAWRLSINSVESGLISGNLTTVLSGGVVTERRAYEIVLEAKRQRWFIGGPIEPGSRRWWFHQHLDAAVRKEGWRHA